jgi:uncharacterized membrane protein
MAFIFTLKFLKIAATSVVIFVLLDFLWLAVIASTMYRQSLGYLADLDPDGKIVFNIPMGLLAQLAISIALSVFISLALQIDNRLVTALGTGAFLGVMMYVTYDFTNLSFVKGWPLWISLIDVTWGAVQGALAGLYVFYFTRWF